MKFKTGLVMFVSAIIGFAISSYLISIGVDPKWIILFCVIALVLWFFGFYVMLDDRLEDKGHLYIEPDWINKNPDGVV